MKAKAPGKTGSSNMCKENLTDDLRQFILSIPSIPYLEAILLLKGPPIRPWSSETVGKRLYLAKDQVGIIMRRLCDAHICNVVPDHPDQYIYHPESTELDDLISRLINFYAHNLIEVTHLIHSNASQKNVQQYADAFKWRSSRQ
jgi:hypothetical protein